MCNFFLLTWLPRVGVFSSSVLGRTSNCLDRQPWTANSHWLPTDRMTNNIGSLSTHAKTISDHKSRIWHRSFLVTFTFHILSVAYASSHLEVTRFTGSNAETYVTSEMNGCDDIITLLSVMRHHNKTETVESHSHNISYQYPEFY